MSGLADELLADLDGLSDNGDEYQEEGEDPQPTPGVSGGRKRKASGSDAEMSDADEQEGGDQEETKQSGVLVLEGGIRPADELDAEEVQRMELGEVDDVTKVTKLDGSRKMVETLKVCSLPFASFALD